MIDVRKHIVDLILHATGLYCYYIYPPQEAELPCIAYNEVTNDDHIIALNNEYANIAYTFTIYANNPLEIFVAAEQIDEAMRYDGFIKDYTSPDMYADGAYYKTYRFKAIINDRDERYN